MIKSSDPEDFTLTVSVDKDALGDQVIKVTGTPEGAAPPRPLT